MKYIKIKSLLFLSVVLLPIGVWGQNYFVYVAAESDDMVYSIKFDGKEASIYDKIPVGTIPTEIEGPHGITVGPKGKYWYLSMAHGIPYGKLYKFSTATNELVGQTELGIFPASMQISSATGMLFVVNFNLHGKMLPSTVSVVDPETMTEITQITTGAMPHGSRISPDGMKQYSVAMMSGELFEVDVLDLKVARTLVLDDMDHSKMDHSKMDHSSMDHGKANEHQGQNHTGHKMENKSMMHHSNVKPTWVIPHPKELKVYIAGNGSQQILEVDLEKWEVSHKFDGGKGPYNVELTPDGKKMVVTYKSEGTTGIWDLTTKKELARIKNSRKVSHGIANSSDSKYAFISIEGIGGEPGSVDVIDLEKLELVSVVEVGKQAGGIGFWKMEGVK